MNLEEAKAVVRGAGFRANPYRVGRVMGEHDGRAFVAWRDACKAAKDYSNPRPLRSRCPYTFANSVRQWEAGLRYGMQRVGAL